MYDLILAVRLIVSAILGGAIGWERERLGKAAGLRTHILVCCGSTLFTIVSILMAEKFPNADPTRIAAQIVTGIGFLGAGAIFRLGPTVRGLTTAATIWISAAIGLSVGAGYFYLGITTTIISLITLEILSKFEAKGRE